MKKTSNPAIKQKTTNEIYDGISDLLIDDNPDLLTITNISKRSGYSIGNIYHHFKNVDNVIEEFVFKRMQSRLDGVIKKLNEFPPSATAKEIVNFLNNDMFLHLTKLIPKAFFLKFAATFMTKGHITTRMDAIHLELVGPIEAMIYRNETDTFKKLTHAEIELAILIASNALRKPLITNHKLAMTESHKQQSLAIMMALFAK
jgi:AcrR family transcriptional regulator